MTSTSEPGDSGLSEALTAPAAATTGGRFVGPYQLLEKIGEGGMGEVWLAEQTRPVRRQVALKLVKVGMDTATVIARFESERQALALMDHAAIAKVFDGGSTEDGRPYFVMEYVRGEPITDFCDRSRMPLTERLALFISLCGGVQHAHQKGIIHRDLKPSNILASRAGDAAIARIIDFGIAKAVAHRLTDTPLHTEFGSFIGTPEYTSPEQAAGSVDIDTRADIYALGVVLYELVTGTTPLRLGDLRQRSIVELHAALQVTPAAPSQRLSESPDLPAVAAARGTDGRALVHNVRGELDWLVLKALDVERNRRYETADALARDVRRLLSHEPITAARPTLRYRARKFVVRNTAAVAACVLTLAALVAGLAGTLWQASIAARERDIAQREADNSRAVTEFVIESLEAGDPETGGRQSISVADAMKAAALRLESGSLRSQPDTSAVLQRAIASILNSNGRTSDALPLAEKSLALEREVHGGDHEHVADSAHTLAFVYLADGRVADAESHAKEALAMHGRLVPTDSIGRLDALLTLGSVHVRQSKFAEALDASSQSVDLARRLFPSGDHRVASALNMSAVINRNLGNLARAEELFVEALTAHRELSPGDHPDVAIGMLNLGAVRRRLGRLADAEPILREAIAMLRRLYSGDHRNIAAALIMLGQTEFQLGDLQAADLTVREAIAMADRLSSGDQPLKVSALAALADLSIASGDLAAADKAAQASLAMNRRLFRGDHLETHINLQRLARIQAARGDWPSASALATEAAAMAGRVHPGGNPALTAATDLLDQVKRKTLMPPRP